MRRLAAVIPAALAFWALAAVPKGSEAPRKEIMGKVTGIGGVFIKSKDPEKLYAWYGKYLGIQKGEFGAVFRWRELDRDKPVGKTTWALFPQNTKYLGATDNAFMINYRVENLDAVLKQLEADGIRIEDRQEADYGRFAWVTDPEGHRIELWEPKG
jgi:catechol 2,3-dioxygenase-like lactoylglutathione lyase family enzyme